ncbi:MAG: 3-hydroxyacyl-CoA dehydrogenase, partial [Deltaproteobacteria bacterium]|nr:3-hydroxyacyl-CoA dehydrogenase [Deltaproteobacteria bacterium]
PGPDTLPEVVESLGELGEKILGKGVVYANDTPNFVANRIGVFGLLCGIKAMVEMGLTVEAVDKLTGPVIGHPKSASFRTGDLVGLDTLVHTADNVYDGAPDDERREIFSAPDFLKQMLDKNLLGDKTRQGFYKKSKDEQGARIILSIDYKTLEYSPLEKVKFPSLETVKDLSGASQKIKALFFSEDAAGEFTFRTLTETLIYSANRIPEIADDIVNTDNA